jgi:hypothetical protein
MTDSKPVEQTAKEVRDDLNNGKLSKGTEALQQGYLDWMKAGKEEGQYWSRLKDAGHFSEDDMRDLALGFAHNNFAPMSENFSRGVLGSSPFVNSDTIDKFVSKQKDVGISEGKFAEKMGDYLKKALNTDDAFHHGGWRDIPGVNLFTWSSGNYFSKADLDSRIGQVNVQDNARANPLAGDIARQLETTGSNGRTLFDRMCPRMPNGDTAPSLSPEDIRNASKSGAYSAEEQKTISKMLKGMDDPSSPEGIAMSQLQLSDQNNKITRDTMKAVEVATQPVDQPKAADMVPGAVAKGAMEALGSLVPADPKADPPLKKLAPNGTVTHDSVDGFLQDQSNQMSFNQRQALEKLRDALPTDNSPASLSDLAMGGGYKTADGKVDQAAFEKQEQGERQKGRDLLAGLHDNVAAASVVNDQKVITPDTIGAAMKQMEADAAKPGGTAVTENPAYKTLQGFKDKFNDISADGKTVTPADMARYASQCSDDGKGTFQGFKGESAQSLQPGPLPAEVQKQAEQDAQELMAPQKVQLGLAPLLEQAAQILQKAGGEASLQAARQLLSDMAALNKWPGTKEQWANYVNDGRPSHLPKELNGAMRSGMEMLVPPPKMSAQDQHALALRQADSRVPIVNLNLSDAQVQTVKDALKDKVPQAAQGSPEQINAFVVHNPQVLDGKLQPEQQQAIGTRSAMIEAYGKAVEEALKKLQPATEAPQSEVPTQPQPQPQPKAPKPEPRHHHHHRQRPEQQ